LNKVLAKPVTAVFMECGFRRNDGSLPLRSLHSASLSLPDDSARGFRGRGEANVFLKSFALMPLLIGGFYVAGVFDAGSYARDIPRPPAEVMDALADLDISAQPGSPGTEASRSGGVQPVFLVEREEDRMIWTVMSGDKVAIRMTAVVKGSKAGSRVTAFVERGNAPDELVSPAFRSTGITMGLFGSALDDELGELTAAAAADPAVCEALLERFEMENMALGAGVDTDDLGRAIGTTAKIAVQLRAQQEELQRVGCATKRSHGGDKFETVTDSMGAGSSSGPGGGAMGSGSAMMEDPTKIDPSATEIPAGIR
jgi:hypothetical protein